MSLKRIRKEFQDLLKNDSELFTAEPKGDENMFEWVAAIYGPNDSPYEGGVFWLDIIFPNDYPFKPPRVKFITPIYHPNISRNGHISIDMLEDHWSPAITLSKILHTIWVFLTSPCPDDPMDPHIAKLYKTDRDLYNKTVREWTKKHAT